MMGFQIAAALFEIIILPMTGMVYMLALFPSRYPPLKSFLMQCPIVLFQLPEILWINEPNFIQMKFLIGGADLVLVAYVYYRVFAVPLRTACAWYFAYCMASPFSIVSTGYMMFSPCGDIATADVNTAAMFARFLLKQAFILLVSAVLIGAIRRLYAWLPLRQRSLEWIERCCNAFYLFFTGIWIAFVVLQSTITLRHIMPYIITAGIFSVVALKLLFDTAEKRQLTQEHDYLARQCALQYQSFQDTLSHEQSIRKFRHDMVGHLQTIRAFLEQRQFDRVKRYAAQLAAQYREQVQPQISDRALIDLVVRQYRQVCRTAGIRLDCAAEAVPAAVSADLMCLLADLLEYHIARCRDMPDDSRPRIALSLCRQADGLRIVCTDTVPGTPRAGRQAFRQLAEQAHRCGARLQREQNATILTANTSQMPQHEA